MESETLGANAGRRSPRIPDLAAFVDHRGGGAEVFGGKLTHQLHRLPLRIRSRPVLRKLKHWHETCPAERPPAGKLQLQHSSHPERAGEVESAIGHEIAQR